MKRQLPAGKLGQTTKQKSESERKGGGLKEGKNIKIKKDQGWITQHLPPKPAGVEKIEGKLAMG